VASLAFAALDSAEGSVQEPASGPILSQVSGTNNVSKRVKGMGTRGAEITNEICKRSIAITCAQSHGREFRGAFCSAF
jgi:hypothetical protein